MSKLFFTALYATCVLVAFASNTGKKVTMKDCSVVKAGYRFSYSLYKELSRRSPGENLFFSPFSLSVATSMVMLGTGGETEKELKSFLQHGLCNTDSMRIHAANRNLLERIEEYVPDMTLRAANKLFPDVSFNMYFNYTQKSADYYGSEVEKVDYGKNPELARMIVNDWVSDETEQLIEELLPAGTIDARTEVVLANVIYFKGTWKTQFDPRNTRNGDFQVDTQTKMSVPFMSNKAKYKYASNDLFSVVELPYIGDAASMIIVLPTEKHGLGFLEKILSGDFLRAFQNYGAVKEVTVVLPKFKMEYASDLVESYKELGVNSLFGMGADFSKMTDSTNLFITDIRHKAFIEVNEEGTEAAAATAFAGARMLRRVDRFVCDHPFLFYIVHKQTSAILFLGRYMKPE